MLVALIIFSVLITSILSGILGMAGGMILMAILVASLSVAGAMMLHGAIQATANGSRAMFLRAHIQWRILPPYLLGAALALGAFFVVSLVPPAGLVLLLLGLFPWLGRAVPHLRGLNICQPATAFGCGVVITAAQLLAGASGPLLDLFYLNSPLTRHQVVASKAITQAAGHVIKLGYYAWAAVQLADAGGPEALARELPAWVYAAAVGTAVLGTRIGTRILDRLGEATFRRVSTWVILAIASVCVVSGIWQLTAG